MRLLVLIMTGIGFTLGLLCGLLLQLPADGLPASDNLNLRAISDGGSDFVHRSRRSFSDGNPNDVENPNSASHFSSSGQSGESPQVLGKSGEGKPAYSHSGADFNSRGKQSFQSPPNPVIVQAPIVLGERGPDQGAGDKGRPQGTGTISGQLLTHPEPGNAKSKAHGGVRQEGTLESADGTGFSAGKKPSEGRWPERSSGQRPSEDPLHNPPHSNSGSSGVVAAGGSVNQQGEAPQPRPHSENTATQPEAAAGDSEPPRQQPVTSFTLRLKKSGQKVVIDSIPQGANAEKNSDTNSGQKSESHSGESSRNNLPFDRVVSGVLWSKELEKTCPSGFEPREVAAWRRMVRGMQVVGVEEGCGRMQNRLVTFRDASKACARYRLNTDQIQGEVYSYYLARLLNITNLPPAVMLPVDTLSEQWRAVHLDMSLAQWADGRLVVLTQWLDHLKPSHIPHELREDDRKLHPTQGILGGKSVEELCDLLQWSDLIVFDFLTANLDRLVNNMFNKQWNADMMNNPAHNLERTKDGSLVFLDNESGLFHGYRLLDKYHDYHESLLNSLCVFRESTAKAVKVLHKAGSVGEELTKLFTEGEDHHKHLPSIPDKNVSVLKDRLGRVYDQIVRCEKLYGGQR